MQIVWLYEASKCSGRYAWIPVSLELGSSSCCTAAFFADTTSLIVNPFFAFWRCVPRWRTAVAFACLGTWGRLVSGAGSPETKFLCERDFQDRQDLNLRITLQLPTSRRPHSCLLFTSNQRILR